MGKPRWRRIFPKVRLQFAESQLHGSSHEDMKSAHKENTLSGRWCCYPCCFRHLSEADDCRLKCTCTSSIRSSHVPRMRCLSMAPYTLLPTAISPQHSLPHCPTNNPNNKYVFLQYSPALLTTLASAAWSSWALCFNLCATACSGLLSA